MNLNEVFWKDLINDNIKSHQKNRALLSLSRRYISGKTTEGGSI